MWKLLVKLVKYLLATLGVILVLLVVGPLVFSFNPFAKSDRAFCVVVSDPAHFTGRYLKRSQSESARVTKIQSCELHDQQIDAGDGPKAGRVRWAQCPRGPDCDEAGRF